LVLEGRPDTLILNLNYDIAIKYGLMPDVILNEIEDDKLKRPSLYRHKWLGKPNSMERKIYKDWNIIDEIPHEAKLERYGLDFGYTNDPTAIVAIYKYNGGFIFDEICYTKGLSNKQIADIILSLNSALVVADSAEPKSIDEIRGYGLLITGATKGQGSINHGIQFVQDQRCSITKRSVNLIKEYKIPVPSIEEQKLIIEKAESLRLETKKLEAIYQQKINDLEELKKSVLQKAFSGELKTAKELVL
jgi:phage terminase large subunit